MGLIAKQVYCTKEDGLLISQPKTKSSIRTIIQPSPMLAILVEYRKDVDFCWVFSSMVKEVSPMDSGSVRQRPYLILEHAQCKQVRFHDLSHTFATTALGSGMEVKTLSAMPVHVSVDTTLDIYTHVTDNHAGRGNGKNQSGDRKSGPAGDTRRVESEANHDYQPYVGKMRKPDTGYIGQKGPNLWGALLTHMNRWQEIRPHLRGVRRKAEGANCGDEGGAGRVEGVEGGEAVPIQTLVKKKQFSFLL